MALEVLADPALGRRALKLLYDAAARALRRGTSSETAPEQRPTAHLLWAIDRLEEMDAQAERHQERYTLLVDAAALPLADEYRDALAQRGAQVAEETLHDRPAALALYQELLARKPGDEALIETIDRLFDAEGLLPQRIHLRRTQLEGVDNPEKKRALRLLISQLVDALAAFAGRDEMLLASLADQPGDRASLDAIERDWRDRHRFAELVDLYAHQAQQVAAAGARERAAELWLQAGIFADENLAAPERATQLIGAAVALVPSEDALDRLAILTRQLGRHKEQARWLEQRLSLAAPSESLDIALQLVDAHLAAGDDTRAIAVLEQARQHHPSTERLWRKLAELYRAHEVWPALATLLSDVVAAGDDAELVLELIHEASAIFRDKLQRPEGAIDCLERGVALHPDSSALKLSLADCLSAAGRLEEAEQLLRVVVDSFGRRWSAGRADVHRRLAQVLGARGQSQAAIEELELATNMNRADAASLTLLGSLSLQARDLDRAERAYRALLLVARRSHGSASGAPSVSEVLYELHRIADARGDQAQAEELRESAVDTATQHPEEFDRMQALLLADQQYELFVRMVDTRLDALHDAAERAALLVRLAHLYCDPMERPSLALDRCLAALELDVDNDDIHRFALDIAQSCDGVERYTDALQQWLDKMRRAADSRLAGALSLRLGAVEEHVRGNLDAAIEIYRRVEATSDVQVPAWLALGRALVKKDDGQQAVMLFERVLASERSDVAARVEALQHLAELRLQVGAGADSVVQLLQSTDVQLEPLSLTKILRRVLQVEPTHREALALFAERARHFDDPHMLLEYFEFRAADANVSLEDLREGAERAHAIGDRQRAEALLRRAVEVVQARSPESGEAAWAMLRLADLSEEGGDVSAALGWLCQAADALPDAQRRLVQGRIAELASREPGGDLELAVRTYDALHAAEPDNPKFIDALLIVYRRLQDVDSFEALARTAIDDCHSVERRNALRMQWVEFISADSERSADAVELLKQVLQESPEHSDATERLTRLYEQSGYDEELVRLLSGQLDAAELAGDGETMAPLALRLGALLAKVDRDDAITTYRRALDLSPHHRALVEQLLDLWRADDGVAERAELLERLLQTESGAAAARLTEEIAQLWRQVDDVAGVQRVLELGLARCPEHRALRDQLEAWYREGEVWDALADFLVQSAAHDSDPERAVARLEEAATLHDTHLGDPVRAAEVLEQALNLMPNNVALLQHLVTTLRAGDALDAAAAHVEAVLARQPDMPATEQVSLRTLLAELHSEQGQEAAGVRELELAYALDAQVAPALLAMLETWRQSNHIAGNEAEERQALMRSCEILQAMGETARAEEALGQWLQEHPDDVQGWSWLAAAAEAEENWEELIACSERLLELEQDEALVTTVLKLAAAAEALGEPARALAPLRQVYERMPAHAELFQRLQDLYAASDAFAELADLLLLAAAHVPDEQERFTLLLRAGELLVQQVYDPERAVEALQQALTLQPEHHQALLALTDALTALDRLEEAGQVLADAITNHRKKRSPELAELQHKMAVVARMSGD
ncbi:MAG: tetratricopeptide repeat protein, partial [Polyangiales bacterium]